MMIQQELKSVNIIGISVRTSNLRGQAEKDIPGLWGKFLSNTVAEHIPNKTGDDTYCVYTEYEGDHTAPYTVLIGCPVASLDRIPEGFSGVTIEKGPYQKFTAKGNLMHGVIWQEWQKIWQLDLERNYRTDFEVYGQRAQHPEDAEVDIYVGLGK